MSINKMQENNIIARALFEKNIYSKMQVCGFIGLYILLLRRSSFAASKHVNVYLLLSNIACHF